MSSITEKEIQAITVAPRVTLDDVKDFIKSEEYLYTQTLTFCVLTLKNGFTVTGESACASKENYNKEIGDRLAKENAQNKIWGLLGFELRSKLHLIETTAKPSGAIISLGAPRTAIGTKVVHFVAMTRQEYNNYRGWILPEGEDGSDNGYLVEYTDGGTPNVPGHPGYVSWSPQDVFEKSYHTSVRRTLSELEPENFLTRMKKELDELKDRTMKLQIFITSPAFFKLQEIERIDLQEQFVSMREYEEVLERRYARNSQ